MLIGVNDIPSMLINEVADLSGETLLIWTGDQKYCSLATTSLIVHLATGSSYLLRSTGGCCNQRHFSEKTKTHCSHPFYAW